MAKINWGKISKQISESAALKDKMREAQTRQYDADATYKNRLIDSQLEAQGMGDRNRLEVEGLRGQNTLANTDRTADHQKAAATATDNRNWLADQQAAIGEKEKFKRDTAIEGWQAGLSGAEAQGMIDAPGGINIAGMDYPQAAQKPTGSFEKIRTGKGSEESPVYFDPATGTARLLTLDGMPQEQYNQVMGMQQTAPDPRQQIQGTPPGRTPVGSRVMEKIDAGEYGASRGGGQQQASPMSALVEDAMKNLGSNFDPTGDVAPETVNYLRQLQQNSPDVYKAIRDKYR